MFACALQVFGLQSRVLAMRGEHAETDFIVIMERENKVWPTRARQGLV